MKYLRLRRTQIILGAFALFAVAAMTFPAVDLAISRLFFDGRTFLRDVWWQEFLHTTLNWFLGGSLGIVTAVYAYNRMSNRQLAGIDGRKVLFLFLVLIVGAGLIVNAGFKDSFGRARPRNIVEFGGTKQFTPAFVISRECDTNCSFSSGDAAGGFFAIALAMALTRRRSWYVAAIVTGVVFSLARVSSGAHFFSDTIASFFVMLIVSDALFYFIVLKNAGSPGSAALGKPRLALVTPGDGPSR